MHASTCGHCGDTYTAGRSDKQFCSDRCRLRQWRSRRRVRSAEAIEAERVRELIAEIERLERQVVELQGANATLREAHSRVQLRLVSVLGRYGRLELTDGSWQ